MPSWNDSDGSHDDWRRDIHEAKVITRSYIFEIEDSDTPGDQVIVKPSEDSENPHVRLHSAIIDYADQLRPTRDRLNGEWEDTLYEIDYPVQEEISLNALPRWRKRIERIRVKGDHPVHGKTNDVEEYRLCIPPLAAYECYDRLNEIVTELQLGIELKEPEYDPETEDPL